MDNDELRLAIAKAKGYSVIRSNRGVALISAATGFNDLPNWPESNADAMTLMQEAADQNVYVTLFFSRNSKKWVARFHRTQTTAHADTLSRAVSEAYYNWQTMDAQP